MAIPLNSLSPAEIEFMAEDEIVTIVPNFQMEHLHFISVRAGARRVWTIADPRLTVRPSICHASTSAQGSYGPFRPQRPATVPLWLAVTLKKRAKCKIQPPEFLRTGRSALQPAGEGENCDAQFGVSPCRAQPCSVQKRCEACWSAKSRRMPFVRCRSTTWRSPTSSSKRTT